MSNIYNINYTVLINLILNKNSNDNYYYNTIILVIKIIFIE